METLTVAPKTEKIPFLTKEEAARRHLISDAVLAKMRLSPLGDPVARGKEQSGDVLYFDENKVTVKVSKKPSAPKKPAAPKAPLPEPGFVPGEMKRVSARRAPAMGLFSAAVLKEMFYQPVGDPVAFYVKKDGTRVELYQRATAVRLPLPCAACGAPQRHRAKLCRDCYDKEMAVRLAEGEARRNAHYGKKPKDVLFFDMEMTGVYQHDEVLSVTVMDGNGSILLDTLVRPRRHSKWPETEPIHGITPEMVKNSPTYSQIAPKLRSLLDRAKTLVAFGTNTDFLHLKRLYPTAAERTRLHRKLLDCGLEFSRYIHEHQIELSHLSLSDAMAYFQLPWIGTAHSSTADTLACQRVFSVLYPHYFESENA